MLAIVEVRVRSPDLVQHLDAQRETLDGPLETESLIAPVLPEIAIHRVVHVQLRNGSHAAYEYVGAHHRGQALSVRGQLRLLVTLEQILQYTRYIPAEHVRRCGAWTQQTTGWGSRCKRFSGRVHVASIETTFAHRSKGFVNAAGLKLAGYQWHPGRSRGRHSVALQQAHEGGQQAECV